MGRPPKYQTAEERVAAKNAAHRLRQQRYEQRQKQTKNAEIARSAESLEIPLSKAFELLATQQPMAENTRLFNRFRQQRFQKKKRLERELLNAAFDQLRSR